MGVRQVLRGDPETKQYVVVNNFSGGINTTDIDDAVQDNEFRMLQNVELGQEGGMIKNRKGFGPISLLNDLIEDKGVHLPLYIPSSQTETERCFMIRIVKNTNNAFAKFEQYASISDYQWGTRYVDIKLHILFNFNGVFKLLKIEKPIETENTLSDFTVSLTDLTTVHRDDFFPWSSASAEEWGAYGNVGGTYDTVGTDLPVAPYYHTYGRVNLGESYLYYKSVYENVSVFHDRVLSVEAVDYLDYTYVLGSYISPQAGTTLYVYDSKLESMSTITRENCYKPNPFEVTSFGGAAALGFNVFAKAPLTYVKDQDIGTKSILGVYFTNTTTGAYLEKIPTSGDFTVNVLQYGSSMSPYELKLTFRIGNTADEKTYAISTARDIGGIFQYDIVDLDVSGVSYFMLDIEKADVWAELTDENSLGGLVEDTVPIGAIMHAIAEDTYWALIIRPVTLGIHNFVQIDYDQNETIVSRLGQVVDVGSTPNEQVVASIDLSGARMMLINVIYSNPRMLYYKGNTLWFSDVGQFDYLPNVNFVMLPIDADDEITSVNFYRNNYIIFTKTSIFKMSGDYEDPNFSISLVNGNIGCIAPYSIKGANNSLIFLSVDGLYKLTANVYADGLENVTKIDKKIKGLFMPNQFAEAVIYNEQYILFLKNDTYHALHYYFNIGSSEHPFTVSLFRIRPTIIAKLDQILVSLTSGGEWNTEIGAQLFMYDKGFLDFFMDNGGEVNCPSFQYMCKIVTTRNSLGYPTHNKKYKSCYIKTYYSGTSVVYITALVDDYLIVDPNTYKVTRTNTGALVYTRYDDPENDAILSLELDVDELGGFELGTATLGDSPFTIHKVTIGGKGNNIQLMLEHSSNGQFGISSIGHVFKVGKVKESR